MQMEEKDKLDQFFKARLSGQDAGASPDGWDVPSDRVWAGIESEIADRRQPVVWWRVLLIALLALLALLFAGLWFASQRQVEQLEKTVAQQRQEIREIIAANKPVQSVTDEGAGLAEADVETGSAESEKAFAEEGAANLGTADRSSQVIASDKGISPPFGYEDLTAPSNFAEGQTNAVAEEGKTETPEGIVKSGINESRQTIATSVLIPGLWNFLEVDHPDLSVNFDLGPDGSRHVSKARMLPLEFSFSPVLSDRLLTYKGKDIDTKFERTETAGFSWTASVLTGVQFSDKLRLLTGLDYFSYSQESTHLMALRYTLQNSQTDMFGNRINTYTTDVPTSFGDASIEIRVADDGAANNPDLSEGRLFPVEITAGTNIRQLGVPLLLEYRSGRGPVQWISLAGLIGNWIIDGEFSLQRARVVHPRMQARSFRMTSDKLTRRLKDFTLDMQLSSGAQLNLNDRINLTLLPTFRTNLTPIFDNEKLKTNIYSWSLNVGLAFQL